MLALHLTFSFRKIHFIIFYLFPCPSEVTFLTSLEFNNSKSWNGSWIPKLLSYHSEQVYGESNFAWVEKSTIFYSENWK